jgi:hypothetical protein
MKRVLLIMLCLGALCLSAAPALASPTNSAYSGTGATQISQVQSVQTAAKPSTSALPFTGLNLAVVGLVAVVLAGSGLILRHRSAADRK